MLAATAQVVVQLCRSMENSATMAAAATHGVEGAASSVEAKSGAVRGAMGWAVLALGGLAGVMVLS